MTDDLLAQIEAVASNGFQDVTVGGLTVPLRPVTIMETIRLVRRFPDMKEALFGVLETAAAGGELDVANFNPKNLLSIALEAGPEAIAAFIALAAGAGGDARAEKAFGSLPDEDLVTLAVAVKDLTMPEGIEPFFARLTAVVMAEKGRKPAAEKPAQKRVRRAA